MDLYTRYKTFIREHTTKVIAVNDVEWKYLIGGSGEVPLLLLPGGTRQPGMRFQFLSELEEKYRTIYPFYPLVCQMKPLIDGLAAILDNESLTKTHVFGSSFGGLVGQYFLKEYPNRIGKLILSNTGTTIKTQNQVKKLKRIRNVLKFVPERLIHAFTVRSFIKGIRFPESDLSFYKKFLRDSFSKKVVLCHFDCLIDFQETFSIQPSNLEQWGGQMLIISAADDELVGKESSNALKSVYPNVEFYTFDSGGHVLNITRHNEYKQLITDFLASD